MFHKLSISYVIVVRVLYLNITEVSIREARMYIFLFYNIVFQSNYFTLPVTQTIFMSESIQDMMPLAANRVLILGQGNFSPLFFFPVFVNEGCKIVFARFWT